MRIAIDRPLLENLLNKSSLMLFSETGNISHIVHYKGKPYVTMGSMSSGEKGLLQVDAYGIELLSLYTGPLIPADRIKHYDEVCQGIRARGYPGQIAELDGVKYVITEEKIIFTPTENGVQLEMFN